MPPKGFPKALAFWLVPVALFAALYLMAPRSVPLEELSYSQFLAAVRNDSVRAVQIMERRAVGEYRDGRQFSVNLPPQAGDLPALLEQHRVEQKYKPPGNPSPWLGLAPILLWALVIGAFFWLQTRRGGAGAQQLPVGVARTRWLKPGDSRITFNDVAGIDEVKEDLMELVDFLKHPDKYRRMGAKIPKGVLLYGPPGTGKTLVARAVAGEAGVPFISYSGSEFVELFVGMGASRVRELFAQARRQAPCIIFIDELDAVGRQRGPGLGGGHDEREQTLNQLLVELDGFDAFAGIIVMAATNRPDVLDQALLRPGRFDRRLPVDRPDVRAREAILKVHARGKVMEAEVDLTTVARSTAGFTGADLANLLNEATLLAVRRGKAAVGMAEIDDAVDRAVVGGPEKKNRVIPPEVKHRVAVHEAGHALVGSLLPGMPPVDKVTIIGRGRAGGFTRYAMDDDKFLQTRSDLVKQLAALLAGREAERLILGEVSTGASNDLERAAGLAKEMVSRFGMSEGLGPAGAGSEWLPDGSRDRSEALAAEVDQEARQVLTEAEAVARDLLAQHRDRLERVTAALLEHETLDARAFRQAMADPAAGGAAPAPVLA